jgi:hypothetical protein
MEMYIDARMKIYFWEIYFQGIWNFLIKQRYVQPISVAAHIMELGM